MAAAAAAAYGTRSLLFRPPRTDRRFLLAARLPVMSPPPSGRPSGRCPLPRGLRGTWAGTCGHFCPRGARQGRVRPPPAGLSLSPSLLPGAAGSR